MIIPSAFRGATPTPPNTQSKDGRGGEALLEGGDTLVCTWVRKHKNDGHGVLRSAAECPQSRGDSRVPATLISR